MADTRPSIFNTDDDYARFLATSMREADQSARPTTRLYGPPSRRVSWTSPGFFSIKHDTPNDGASMTVRWLPPGATLDLYTDAEPDVNVTVRERRADDTESFPENFRTLRDVQQMAARNREDFES
jgi:hypothetical protein